MGISPMSQPVWTAVVKVKPKAWSIWWTKMPKKPITARAGQDRRGGQAVPPRRRTISRSSAVPRANRVKIRVVGDISRSAALVATNERPHRTTAVSAPVRGGIVRFRQCFNTAGAHAARALRALNCLGPALRHRDRSLSCLYDQYLRQKERANIHR